MNSHTAEDPLHPEQTFMKLVKKKKGQIPQISAERKYLGYQKRPQQSDYKHKLTYSDFI